MRKLLSAFVFTLLGLSAGYAQPKPLNDSTWQLAFSDEFNTGPVDPNIWWGNWSGNAPSSYRVFKDWLNFNAVDTLTNEDILPFITPNFENCDVSGGSLKIRSKKEHRDSCKVWDRWVWDDCWVPGDYTWCPIDTFVSFEYTTGLLMSKQPFKYGYYEIRMRMPDPATTFANKGLGPNFWLYSSMDTCIWSEIDIFEFAGYENLGHRQNLHTSNVHSQKYAGADFGTLTTNPADTLHTGDFSTEGEITFSNNYHVFGMNWLPDRVEFYHNGILYKTSTDPGIFSNKLTEMYMFIELNHPTTNFATLVDTTQTVFPFTYEVDYVRCWQYKQHCDSILPICNFNYSSFDPAVYKQITAGGTGCNSTIPATKNVSFRANDFVLLQEGFEVGNNAMFLGAVTSCMEYVNPYNRIPSSAPNFQDSPYLNQERIKHKHE
ncbi:MAG: hypothetical protein K0S33_1104 [Bacteroidetes bacterium]|jgi:hypothetical protein|nr:hypothetical protein [Bacteroidota bacterium]